MGGAALGRGGCARVAERQPGLWPAARGGDTCSGACSFSHRVFTEQRVVPRVLSGHQPQLPGQHAQARAHGPHHRPPRGPQRPQHAPRGDHRPHQDGQWRLEEREPPGEWGRGGGHVWPRALGRWPRGAGLGFRIESPRPRRAPPSLFPCKVAQRGACLGGLCAFKKTQGRGWLWGAPTDVADGARAADVFSPGSGGPRSRCGRVGR